MRGRMRQADRAQLERELVERGASGRASLAAVDTFAREDTAFDSSAGLFARLAMPLCDVLLLIVSAYLSSFVAFGRLSGGFPQSTLEPDIVLLPLEMTLIACVLLFLDGQYDPKGLFWGSGQLSRAVGSLVLAFTLQMMLRYALGAPRLDRVWSLVWMVSSCTLLLAERLAIRQVIAWKHRRGRLIRPVLVVGSNSQAAAVVRSLERRRGEGLRPIGCLASSRKDRLSLDYTPSSLPNLGTAIDLMDVIAEHKVEMVVVVSSAFDHEVLTRMVAELNSAPVEVFLSTSLGDVMVQRLRMREVAGMPLIALRRLSLSSTNKVLKRTFEIVVASGVIVLGLPLWLLLAAAIKLTAPGPVFYRQERVGVRGRRFRMFKFRTMVVDADKVLDEVKKSRRIETGPLFKLKHDPRVTVVGRWLRRFSIDEFPQLINVLLGEMSLVGPRPPLPPETRYYHDKHWRRMDVLPGMTGLWQVSGRSDLSFEEMVALDLFYISNWSLSLDLSLLARTIPAVLMGRGAY